jgi:hypothetical protein
MLAVSYASVAFGAPLLTTEISPRSGQTDDLFIFTVKLSGIQTTGARPRLLNEVDFEATLLGPQTSISIVNGVVDSSVSYVYQLSAKRSGTLKTPAVEVAVDGQKLSAAEITVEVQESSHNPHDHSLDSGNSAAKPSQLFLKQTATPLKPYKGQQVIDALSLYTRVELAEYQLEDFSADGFWQERLIDNDRSVTEVDGQQYTRVEHAKALYPLTHGSVEIPARTVIAKVPVRRKRTSPSLLQFGDDLLGQLLQTVELRDVTLRSNAITLDVQPLPPAPSELQALLGTVALVGATSLHTSYTTDPISVGEMKSIAIEITTEGNVRPLQRLVLPTTEGLKVYDQKPETTTSTSSGRVIMKRIFRFSLVPLKGGIVRIPPVRVAYFDPEKRAYLTASSAEISFAVNGPAAGINTPEPLQAKGDSASNGVAGQTKGIPTLSPLPLAPDLDYHEASLAQRLAEFVSVQLALLLLTVAIAITGAATLVIRRQQQGRKLLITPRRIDNVASLSELEALVRAAIAERVPAALEGDSFETLRAQTLESLKDAELAQAICSLIDELELVRYGGQHGCETEELLNTLKSRFSEVLRQWVQR